jgi:hypothetical protein
MAEPPERNISTLMPVSCWNASAIFWPCSIGVEVYQITLPSAFALATSMASCARAGATRVASSAIASVSLSITFPLLCGAVLSFVMRGLDPRIHLLTKRMDCRVKPGNDGTTHQCPLL